MKTIPVPQNNHSLTPKTILVPPNQDMTNFFYPSGLLMASLGNDYFLAKFVLECGTLMANLSMSNGMTYKAHRPKKRMNAMPCVKDLVNGKAFDKSPESLG